MGKYLLVNADDFGMCKSANEAVFDLFQNGRLKSATIMMPCPAAIEAVEFSKAHPEYAIGV
ncbi:MAG: ChbG/HpnK family deacetylase, partial [Clostridia bacterium]|nr:ChbG/HpnK family deacetylase [Clostridia bacterium]